MPAVKPLKAVREGSRFKLVPTEGAEEEEVGPETASPAPPGGKTTAAEGKATLSELGGAGQTLKVIKVNLRELRGGDMRQNIVVRPGDDIQVPLNVLGLFYMRGEVARPGPYNLTGEKMTLKRAIATAGPMMPTAWPSRCEVTRFVGENREVTYRVNLEKLFAGAAPDVLLKPGDLISVGTHPVARWVAVVRDSFRNTYGFGFVYDRNFADKDFGH